MRNRIPLAVSLLAASILLGGCATASPAADDVAVVQNGEGVPPQVDLDEWRDVQSGSALAITPAFAYETLEDLAAASDLIVIARVADQGPFLDRDLVATESQIESLEVLKGTIPDHGIRLYTIGTPVYLPGHSNVDGAGDPPLFDETYVMFLMKLPELTNANGALVPVRDVWQATGFGQYLQTNEGGLVWDGDDDDSRANVSMEDIRTAIASAPDA